VVVVFVKDNFTSLCVLDKEEITDFDLMLDRIRVTTVPLLKRGEHEEEVINK